jgi:hypothetical protein
MFFGTPHRGVDSAIWEEHIVRLLAMSEFEAGSPTQLLYNLAMPLYQGAEEFAQSSWDIKIVNVFQEDGKSEKGPAVRPTLLVAASIHAVHCLPFPYSSFLSTLISSGTRRGLL